MGKYRTSLICIIIGIFTAVAAEILYSFNSIQSKPKYNTKDDIRIPAGLLQKDSNEKSELKLPNYCNNLYFLVCNKKGVTQDPTGWVLPDVEGEKQALELYKKLITKYKLYKGNNEKTYELMTEELVQKIFSKSRRQRILSAYHWVSTQIENFIDRQPNSVFTPKEKQQIKARLRKTQLELPPPAQIYSDEPDLLTKSDVYYERTTNGRMRLRVGGAFVFVSKSWFNLVFTLAHELAHSIDPCEIRSSRLSFPAYDYLSACFLQTGLINTFKTRIECGQNDQLSEVFADWIAVQVTAESLLLYSHEFNGTQIIHAVINSVRDLCDQEDDINELDVFFHPTPKIRIEKIFGSNSIIRNMIGCGSISQNVKECTFGDFR